MGYVILYCVKHIEADPEKTISKVRDIIFRETFEAKVSAAIPEAFKKIREAATPQLFIRPGAYVAAKPRADHGDAIHGEHIAAACAAAGGAGDRNPGPPPPTESIVGPPAPTPPETPPGALQLPGFSPPSEPPAPPTGVFPNRGTRDYHDKSE